VRVAAAELPVCRLLLAEPPQTAFHGPGVDSVLAVGLVRFARPQEGQQGQGRGGDVIVVDPVEAPVAVGVLLTGEPLQPPGHRRFRRRVTTSLLEAALLRGTAAAAEAANPQLYAAEIAHAIIQAFAEPFPLDGTPLSLTSSIGISIFPDDGEQVEALIGHADRAMYAAKGEGRNTFRFFNPRMHFAASRRVQEENDLRRAFEQGHLELHYQPRRRIESGKIVAVEALLRWRHPERGLLPAASFMRLAEETGLAIPMGEWVIVTACRQLAAWQRSGTSARIGVNLSRKQFLHPQLEAIATAALRNAGVDPGCLELEVAEETVMENAGRSAERLRRLGEIGVRISVDEFGTGRSSLPWLKRLPIRSVKVDRAFVSDIGADEASAVIQAVIDLSHRLRLEVVAQGVETEAQLTFLANHGCDEAQGRYIGAPVPARELAPFLT